MSIEFIFGIILLAFNIRAWDYRNLPLNIFGVVTFSYFPSWTIAGIVGEYFHERLIQIDEILLNPLGHNHEKIGKAYRKYVKLKKQQRKNKEMKMKIQSLKTWFVIMILLVLWLIQLFVILSSKKV